MSAVLSPPLAVQQEIHRAAIDFLSLLAESGCIEGIAPRPMVRDGPHHFYRLLVSVPMARLEVALNPRRLKCDDQQLKALNVSSSGGERHSFALSNALVEIRDGLDAIFTQEFLRGTVQTGQAKDAEGRTNKRIRASTFGTITSEPNGNSRL